MPHTLAVQHFLLTPTHPHPLVYLSGHGVSEAFDNFHVKIHILAWVVNICVVSQEVAGVCQCLVEVLLSSCVSIPRSFTNIDPL